MNDMENNINLSSMGSMNESITKSVRKVRLKFIMRMFFITFISIVLIFVVIPNIFQGIYYSKMDSYIRMMANLTQFKSPVSVIGHRTKPEFFQTEVGVITNAYESSRTGVYLQGEATTILKPPSMKIDYDEIYGTSFYKEPTENNLLELRTILDHNDKQVAIINISFKKEKSIQEIKEYLRNYKIKISWLAITTGLEFSHSSNVSMSEGSQYRQFGIPTKTISTKTFEKLVLDFNNPEDYIKFIKEELKWSLNHKDLVKKSSDMFIFQEMENVLKTDFMIYGMTIIGTSDELSKLCENEDIAYGQITGFYPWDIIE